MNAVIIWTLVPLLLWGCENQNSQSSGEDISAQDSLRNRLSSLMNLSNNRAGDFEYAQTRLSETEDHTLYRLVLYPAPGDSIPTYFLEPKLVDPPYPLMICLQGHAPGMYISIGDARSEKDQKLIEGGRDIALQAVAHGWAALAVEQRGFGEQEVVGVSCNHLSLNSAMMGKPMLGQRVLDISYVIDFIEREPVIAASTIGCMGNSAGGTTSYFAAAMDQRIQLAVVSSSFSTYEQSWLKYPHCACGYLPGLLEIADMPDLAQLIAPRNLLIIAGTEDYLADIEGVREGYHMAKQFYKNHQAIENLVLAEADGGHKFYPELAWKYIDLFLENGSFEK